MSLSVSKEAFASASDATKLLLIYDLLEENRNLMLEHKQLLISYSKQQKLLCERRGSNCGVRLTALERRKVINVSLSTVGGLIGGFVAMLINLKFFEK